LGWDLATFDLAILDFEMPGMNGSDLFLRMSPPQIPLACACKFGLVRS